MHSTHACNSWHCKYDTGKYRQALILMRCIQKAFDTVDHKILFHRLHHYGFRRVMNMWFSFYLDGRTQTAKIGSYVSYISKRCTVRLSARPFTFPYRCQRYPRILQSFFYLLTTWMPSSSIGLTANKLTLNIQKTNFVIIRPAQNV